MGNTDSLNELRSADGGKRLVLIDGECNLCNGLVQFIIKRDPSGRFEFAPLQSPVARTYLQEAGMSLTDFDTFVLIDGGRLYTRSEAALRIMRKLDGGWPLLYGLKIIPSALRDGVYRLVAKNRYRLFGRRDSCLLPTEDVKRRFRTAQAELASGSGPEGPHR